MRIRNIKPFIALLIGCTVLFTACNTSKEAKVKEALAEANNAGVSGYSYAKEVHISDEKMNEVFKKVNEYIEVDSISDFENTAPTETSVNAIDLRFATVIDKSGKKYQVCFDGVRGILFGIADEDGNQIVEFDQSQIPEDELPLGTEIDADRKPVNNN